MEIRYQVRQIAISTEQCHQRVCPGMSSKRELGRVRFSARPINILQLCPGVAGEIVEICRLRRGGHGLAVFGVSYEPCALQIPSTYQFALNALAWVLHIHIHPGDSELVRWAVMRWSSSMRSGAFALRTRSEMNLCMYHVQYLSGSQTKDSSTTSGGLHLLCISGKSVYATRIALQRIIYSARQKYLPSPSVVALPYLRTEFYRVSLRQCKAPGP